MNEYRVGVGVLALTCISGLSINLSIAANVTSHSVSAEAAAFHFASVPLPWLSMGRRARMPWSCTTSFAGYACRADPSAAEASNL